MVEYSSIVGGPDLKKYMLRERLLWYTDDEYYYNGNYIYYQDFDRQDGTSDTSYDMVSLLNALAISYLLEKPLVLPEFRCSKGFCNLDEFIDMDKFSLYFKFRESSFLRNPRIAETKLNEVAFNIARGRHKRSVVCKRC